MLYRLKSASELGHPLHAAHLFHHLHHAAALHLFHHALHLLELVEQAVDLLHMHARAGCDAALACGFDEVEQMQGMMKKMKGSGMMKMMKRMGGMKGMPKF